MGSIPEGKQLRVAIAGAGMAGCCLAIGLLQNPLLDVHIYEAYPTVGVRGSGLSLHGNAIRAMDCISPEIKKAYFRKSHFMAHEEELEMATQFILASGKHTGTLVAELGKAKGRRTVHRAHFIAGLLEGAIPLERVHFAKRMVDVTEDEQTHKVTISFKDGTTESVDLLFGAEGVKSPTRKFILGAAHPAVDPVNHDDWRAFNAHVPMDEAKKAVPQESIENVRCFCTPIGYINGLPVDLGQTYSVSCYQRDSKSAKKGDPKFNAEQWKGFCPEIDGLISLLEKNPTEDWVVQDHDHAPTYFKSHVAMLGDAAHATYPHAGNGAAQAIEDAAILTGVFAKLSSADDIRAALQAFDEVRRPRSQKVIDITRHFGRMYSEDTDEINLEEMRSQMKEGGMYTNGVDMDAQVRDAVDAFERARRN